MALTNPENDYLAWQDAQTISARRIDDDFTTAFDENERDEHFNHFDALLKDFDFYGPIVVDGIEMPSAEDHEGFVMSMVHAGQKLIDRGASFGEVDGRPLSNLEMYALVTWAQESSDAIYERWIVTFLEWIGVDGDGEERNFTDAESYADDRAAQERFA